MGRLTSTPTSPTNTNNQAGRGRISGGTPQITDEQKVKAGEYVFKRLPEFFGVGAKELQANVLDFFTRSNMAFDKPGDVDFPALNMLDENGKLTFKKTSTPSAIGNNKVLDSPLVKDIKSEYESFKRDKGREPTQDEFNAFYNKTIADYDVKEEQAKTTIKEEVKSRRQDAITKREEASKGLSPIQKFGGAVTEFLPGVLAAAPISYYTAPAKGASLLTKFIHGAGEEILESQLVFNPEEYDKDELLNARMNSALLDVASFGVIKGAGRVLKPIAKFGFNKMGNAFNVVSDNVLNKMGRVAIGDEAVEEALNTATYQIGKQDFIDIMQGRKVVGEAERKFFSSPEWVDVARKYGADYSAYPDILKVTTKVPVEEAIQTKGISGLLEAPAIDIASDVKRMVSEIAHRAASGEVDIASGKSKMLKILFDTMDEAKEYSMKIDRKAVANTIADFTNHIREVDDFNYAVMQREVKQGVVDSLESQAIYDPVLMLRRISNLTKGKTDDATKQIASYNKWARSSGNMQADELAEALNGMGFRVNDTNELIDFANDMPTKGSLKGSIKAPEPFDFESRINDAIKVQGKQIETPFVMANKSMLPNKTSADGLVEGLTEAEKKAVDAGEAVIDQADITPESLNQPDLINEIRNKAARNFPYSFESSKVASYGKAGKELVARGRRAAHKALLTKSEFMKINKDLGMNILTDEQWTNVRRVMEGKASPTSDVSAAMASKLRKIMDDWANKLELGDRRIPNYFPRFLSEEGQEAFRHATTSSDIVKQIASKQGISLQQAMEQLRNAVERSSRKGSFEFPRVVDDLPESFRKNPLEEVLAWENEVARRFGVMDEFGKNVERGKSLVNDMALMGKSLNEQIHISKLGKGYLDKVIGKSGNYTDIAPIFNFLKQSMVVSKLNPITSVANEMQAFISSYLDEGWEGVIKANNKANDELIDSFGLDNLKGKIGDELQAEGFATKWMRWIGMEASEVRGFKRAARATYSGIEKAWDVLKKNPTDEASLRYLRQHGMFVDPEVLNKALQTGELPDIEMKMGVLEGVRRKMFFQVSGERPSWATTDAGSVAYIFHNYLLSQMSLLAQAPLSRQLVYLGLIAPITGVPIYTLRQAIYSALSGEPAEMPQSPLEWFVKASTAGAATPLDVIELTKNKDRILSYAAGGFSPVIDTLTSGRPLKTATESFVPGGSLLSKMLFKDKR